MKKQSNSFKGFLGTFFGTTGKESSRTGALSSYLFGEPFDLRGAIELAEKESQSGRVKETSPSQTIKLK